MSKNNIWILKYSPKLTRRNFTNYYQIVLNAKLKNYRSSDRQSQNQTYTVEEFCSNSFYYKQIIRVFSERRSFFLDVIISNPAFLLIHWCDLVSTIFLPFIVYLSNYSNRPKLLPRVLHNGVVIWSKKCHTDILHSWHDTRQTNQSLKCNLLHLICFKLR